LWSRGLMGVQVVASTVVPAVAGPRGAPDCVYAFLA
jgi:hypothetical protein